MLGPDARFNAPYRYDGAASALAAYGLLSIPGLTGAATDSLRRFPSPERPLRQPPYPGWPPKDEKAGRVVLQTKLVITFLRRIVEPTIVKPAIIMAQVAGSGIAAMSSETLSTNGPI